MLAWPLGTISASPPFQSTGPFHRPVQRLYTIVAVTCLMGQCLGAIKVSCASAVSAVMSTIGVFRSLGLRHRKWKWLGIKLPVDIPRHIFGTAVAQCHAFSWNSRISARVMPRSGRSASHNTFPRDVRHRVRLKSTFDLTHLAKVLVFRKYVQWSCRVSD